MESNKRAAAINLYRQIIEEAPETVDAWIGLGQLLNDRAEKEQAYRQALALDAGNEAALKGMASLSGGPKDGLHLGPKARSGDGGAAGSAKKAGPASRSERLNERPSGRLNERPSERLNERSSGRLNERPSERLNERPSERLNERPSERLNERPSERLNERSRERLNERPSERLNERPSDRPSERPSERLNERPSERPSERPNESPSERPSEWPSEEPSDWPSEEQEVQWPEAPVWPDALNRRQDAPSTPSKPQPMERTAPESASQLPGAPVASLSTGTVAGEQESSDLEADEALVCANHPQRKTNLRCNSCGRPICMACANSTPVGYRCPQCIREREEVFYNATFFDYVIAAFSALIISTLAGMIVPWLGFFVIFLAAIAGSFIGRLVFRLAGRRRGRWLPHLVATMIVVGALPGFLLYGGSWIWIALYLFLATGAAYYQMK
jgi:hypothetical protein